MVAIMNLKKITAYFVMIITVIPFMILVFFPFFRGYAFWDAIHNCAVAIGTLVLILGIFLGWCIALDWSYTQITKK